MSSTNRGATRTPNDFYVTSPDEIVRFLKYWCACDPDAAAFWEQPLRILDPAAGGLTEEVIIEQKKGKPPLVFKPCECSYPVAIQQAFTSFDHGITTIDIRENSKALCHRDYLNDPLPMDGPPDIIITNPPFSLALDFIRHSLVMVKPGGYVVLLLRLNFFGSEDRNAFFLTGNMPHAAYVHSKRLGFTPDGHTDSIEYAHMIFRRTDTPCHETKLRVLPYK